MGKELEGQVAFITGAARGQGRSHAINLAREGVDIIAIDSCIDIDTVAYGLGTEADLAETAAAVEAEGRRVITKRADVRDLAAITKIVDEGVEQFGRLDIVSANAGVLATAPAIETTAQVWSDNIDINLTGAWNTCSATMRHIIEGGRGGSMVLTSSTSGVVGTANLTAYAAAKHGVVGIMRCLAKELAPHNIRVNTLHPTTVDTGMVLNDKMYRTFRPDLDAPTLEDALPAFIDHNLLAVPWVEAQDISNMLMFLVSERGRYVTGTTMLVDAGRTL